MSYQIVIDSCGDLSDGMRNNARITSVPLRIQVGEKEYMDDENLNRKELLADIAHSIRMPVSACPSPVQYVDSCDKNADRIYIITGSSALTGSYNSACLAEKMIREEWEKNTEQKGQKICVIDSKSASAGEMLVARQIIQWENRGMPMETIARKIQTFVEKMVTRFVLEDLTMLERSGRLTGLKAKLADAFHICPVLSSTNEGTICQTGQARGVKRAILAMLRRIMEDAKKQRISGMVISHCCQEEVAIELRRKLKKRFPNISISLVETGGISSMYAGRGGIIVAYA